MINHQTSLLISLLTLILPLVTGFFPQQWKEDIFGNGGISHAAMTETAFDDRAYLYFPTITTISSNMRSARQQIIDANVDVDDDQNTASKHCDGESFDDAKARIQQLKLDAIAALSSTTPDVIKARQDVGGALHTIQDFYAHSNWVELGNTEPNADLIRNGVINMASPSDRTCASCLTLPKPPTWDSVWPIPCVGYDCSMNTNSFTKVTSGYYHGEDVAIPGNFKCRHGGLSDEGSWMGINKDSLNCYWSPHSQLHAKAADLAQQATMQFFDDIKSDASDAAIRLLFGVPTLGFAIDTTGSMDDVIDAVRTQAISIVQGLQGTPNEPGLYVISPFNDPDVGPVTVTSDFQVFQDTINSLTAEGGGNCPEMAMTGMLDALDVMDPDSSLMVFTDAEAKDADLMATVLSKAQDKRIAISIYKYNSDCTDDPADSDSSIPSDWERMMKRQAVAKRFVDVYSQVCASTGGLFHTGPRAEVNNLTSFIENTIKTDVGTILRVEDTLSTTGTGATRFFYVPVDSYITNVMFSFLGSNMSFSVTTPGGDLLTSSTPGLSQTILQDSTYMSLSSPTPGSYKATIVGNGTFTFLSTGVSTLQLSAFNFASIRGRPGHTGWYPMAGNPPFNQDVGGIAELVGAFKTANFSFRTPSYVLADGATTSNITAGSGEPGFPRNSSFFSPTMRVPRQNLLFYVTGEDDKGMPYQRALPAVVIPINDTAPTGNTTVSASTMSSPTDYSSGPTGSPAVSYANATLTCGISVTTPIPPRSMYPANRTGTTGVPPPPMITTGGAAGLKMPRIATTLNAMFGMLFASLLI